MSAIGNVIGSAVDATTGSSDGTSLQDFLSQFSSSDGIWAKTIDPFATFDVSFKFYPSYYWPKPDTNSSSKDKDWKQKLNKTGEAIAKSLVNSAQSAVKNLANNATGGLLGSIMNNQKSIMDRHNSNSDALFGDTTFMEYLAAANMIVGKSDWVGEKAGEAISPLELQLGPYC